MENVSMLSQRFGDWK